MNKRLMRTSKDLELHVARTVTELLKNEGKTYEWKGEGLQQQYLLDEFREQVRPEGNGGARRETAISYLLVAV